MQELKEKLENKNKVEIRRIILEHRNAMTQDEVAVRSSHIHSRLYAMKEFTAANSVMLYASFRNEVDTRGIIEKCINAGKKFFLPAMAKSAVSLVVYEIKDFLKETVIGTFGVIEPKNDSRKCRNLDEIELCLVPGLAFDWHGNRIGWGKGYYDSFFRNFPSKAMKFGLAYDFQVVEKLETTARDVPVDGLITESKILRFDSRK